METIVEPAERCTLLGSWAAVTYLAERDGRSTVPSVGVRTAFEGELSGRAGRRRGRESSEGWRDSAPPRVSGIGRDGHRRDLETPDVVI